MCKIRTTILLVEQKREIFHEDTAILTIEITIKAVRIATIEAAQSLRNDSREHEVYWEDFTILPEGQQDRSSSGFQNPEGCREDN